jgi:transmembrane sensor
MAVQLEQKQATIDTFWKSLIPAQAVFFFLAVVITVVVQVTLYQPPATAIQGDQVSIPVKHERTRSANILALCNTKQIPLVWISNHSIPAKVQQTETRKTDSNHLAYLLLNKENGNELFGYIKFKTRKTTAYDVNLSLGSKVWLNAGSTSRYPIECGGAQRQVELFSKADFHVKGNASSAFQVSFNGT